MAQQNENRIMCPNGWNTFNTANVLSYVHMPEGFAISLAVKNLATCQVIDRFLIGRFGENEEQIHPGIRSYDGTYTELTVTVSDSSFRVQTAVQDDRQFILISPLKTGKCPLVIAVRASVLWNFEGYTICKGNNLYGGFDTRTISVSVTGERCNEEHFQLESPYISVSLREKVAVSSDGAVTTSEAESIMEQARKRVVDSAQQYGDLAEAYQAMRSCLAWDTIYEPEHRRICTPVSRLWNMSWGGYVLFCWDTFFAAEMISLEQKDLAYSNVFAILDEMTEAGFVPNFGAADDYKSRDRSQPPVGSMTVLNLYNRWKEKWFMEETYEALCRWNEWFFTYRRADDGSLCWGSDPFSPRVDAYWETHGVNERFGAALESGLDNSPMYDGISFDPNTHLIKLSDVGLCGLFIHDCDCMIELSKILGRDGSKFEKRKAVVSQALHTLFDESFGLFLNRKTDTKEFSYRISPTNFYALFDSSINEEQIQKCLSHLYSTEEFWGTYVLPSIARNDPAYKEQDYWRGRIWAPMNYLVYRALEACGQTKACSDLAEKSLALILKEWTQYGHVHENYNADTGMGCDVRNSDKFYHWGGLLSYIAILDAEQKHLDK